MTATIRRPLDGMLVLDLGQIYNGPYCGLQLGFMGARVLKIEPLRIGPYELALPGVELDALQQVLECIAYLCP